MAAKPHIAAVSAWRKQCLVPQLVAANEFTTPRIKSRGPNRGALGLPLQSMDQKLNCNDWAQSPLKLYFDLMFRCG